MVLKYDEKYGIFIKSDTRVVFSAPDAYIFFVVRSRAGAASSRRSEPQEAEKSNKLNNRYGGQNEQICNYFRYGMRS